MALNDSVEPFEYLGARGPAFGLDREFASRLAKALMAAEAATGKRSRIVEGRRSAETQAQYYANYKQEPVNYEGRTYQPLKKGGLAAPPGHSRHQLGRAADLEPGAILDWLHANSRQFGIEQLPGHAGEIDPVHFQMVLGNGELAQEPLAAPRLTKPAVGMPSARDKVFSDARALPGGFDPMTVVRQVGQAALRQSQQLRQGGFDALAQVPTVLATVPAMGTLIGNKVRDLTGKAGHAPPPDEMTGLLDIAERIRQLGESATGAGEPIGLPEKAARLALPAITPMGKFTPAATAITEGVQLATDAITPQPVAAAAPVPEAPTVKVDTIGGPASAKAEDFELLGYMGLATMGAMFAPKVFKAFKFGQVPRFRPVEAGPVGLEGMSNRVDLARTADDATAGAMRLAERAGVPRADLDNLNTQFRIQTAAGAQSIGDSAVKHGEADALTGRFRVNTSLAKLQQAETPELAQYLHLRDTFDDLNINKRNMVRGMDMPTVLRQINAMERANPDLRAVAKEYQANLAELRRFESTGTYATLSKKEVRTLNQINANEVPFAGKRVLDQAVERGSPTASLANDLQSRIASRLRNEARGSYLDAVRKSQPSLVKRVTHKQAQDNPHWTVVEFKRRGVTERYAVEPFIKDVMNLDPYAIRSLGGKAAYGMKRFFETTTTGAFAPWFAITSALRSYQIGKLVSKSGGTKGPTVLGSVMAIPQQIIPQAAEHIAKILDNDGWLTKTIGPGPSKAIAAKLYKVFDDSFFAKVERLGSHRGAILQDQVAQANTKLQAAAKFVPDVFKDLFGAYGSILNAVHNAPQFSFARRNVAAGMPLPEATVKARNMTGDPRVTGRYDVRGPQYVNKNGPQWIEGMMDWPVRAYGAATELARESVPWFNYTQQGIKRLASAYVANPVKFTLGAWLYGGLPAAVTYMGAAALGPEYTDYMMNRRSNYNRMMNFYIPIPGRPPEEGIEFPIFHELSIAKAMMETALHHVTHSSMFTPKEDWLNVAKNYAQVTNPLPMPPLGSAAFAAAGMTPPQNLFGGEPFSFKTEPFEQRGSGLSTPVEMMIRALAGGMGDVIGQGYNAMVNSEEGLAGAVSAGIKQAARAATTKAPLVRDVANVHIPISGDTQISRELFKKNDAIHDLVDYVRAWGAKQLPDGEDAPPSDQGVSGNLGEFSTKMRSKRTGGPLAIAMLEGIGVPSVPSPRSEIAGLAMPAPTNPIYQELIKRMYQNFATDSADKQPAGVPRDIQGFLSLWSRRGDYTKYINDLKPVNTGNYAKWQRQLALRPEIKGFLEKQGIDTKNAAATRNFFIKQRQEVDTVLLTLIRRVEAEFSKAMGKPITIEQLDPYAAAR